MGLIGKIVEHTASGVIADALEVPIMALENVSEKLKVSAAKSENGLFEKESGTGLLLIKQHTFSWRDTFDIFDENKEVKYSVKGELVSVKHCLHIFDNSGRELGVVKEKLIPLRSPVSFESNPVDFVIELNGIKLGKVKSKSAFGKKKFEVVFNGWRIEGDIFGWKYKILNGDKEIARITQKVWYSSDTYVVTFPNLKDELLILMLVIALDAANAPKKSEQLKRTANYKIRKIR